VRTAGGAESRDDRALRTAGFGGPALRVGPPYGRSELDSGVGSFHDLARRTARAHGFIYRRTGSSAQADEHAALGTARVKHVMATGTAGSLRHPQVIAGPTIRPQVGAIEPGLIKILAGLHVKSYGDESLLTNRVGRRPASRTAAEILSHALARNMNPIAIVVAVAIAISILRSRERGKCDQQKNSE